MHVVALYVVVLWLPGLLFGRLAGLRGWTLAAAAPLLTYAVAGLAGPAFADGRHRLVAGERLALVLAWRSRWPAVRGRRRLDPAGSPFAPRRGGPSRSWTAPGRHLGVAAAAGGDRRVRRRA